jgi:hypothetical protein
MVSRRGFLKDAAALSAVFLARPQILLEVCEDVPEYSLVTNVPQYTMTLHKNGQEIRRYEVGVGMPFIFKNILGDTRTPLGEYKILTKADWNDSFAGTWMQFKKNIIDGKDWGGWGIHGSPHKEFVGHALSKGCIRLTPEEAEELKKIVPIGTAIRNVYEPVRLSGELLEIYSDVYSLMNDMKAPILEAVSLEGRLISDAKVNGILEESEKRRKTYVENVAELYKKYIRPLPDNQAHPDLLQKNPEIGSKYLKTLSENRKLVVPVEELLI